MKKKTIIFLFTLFFCLINFCISINASENETEMRMYIYQEYALETDIPWYIIGAIDQFERNTKNYRSYCPKESEVVSLCFDTKLWSGWLNPIEEDTNLYRINLFHGFGKDGDGDGLADRNNPKDKMKAFFDYVLSYGTSEEKIREALFNYYQNQKAVDIVFSIAKLFNHFNAIDLDKRVHPIPKGYIASIVNNYGQGRSYGGPRVHEGIDIFAHYGTPVVSTAYGIVEIKGWNRLGGYRIGIRDIYNTYEFYAHLTGYAKGIEEGTIVEPGQVIGYVGSTGYGKEGTSGKFPPHLHFGLYKFDGKKEWSFNPYPYLKKWERVWLK